VFALVSGAGTTVCVIGDPDGDGICNDTQDNCTLIANPGQRDDDEDGYGNICDQDVDQNCGIGLSDMTATFALFGTISPWTPKNLGAFDVDENGGVGLSDMTNEFSRFGSSPGPSSRLCADCLATPTAGLGLGVCP
jgi:hypothetical protein